MKPSLNNNPRNPTKLDIRVQVSADALAKLWLWVDLAAGEVSTLGIVEQILDTKTGTIAALRITDFLLVDQDCCSVETTMDPLAIALLLAELESNGQDSGKLLCWAHSHADMQVFWSGTDAACIGGLANGGYLLSLVVNKNRDAMMRLDVFHPTHLFLNDIVWEIHCPQDDASRTACIEEFKAKVHDGYLTQTPIGNGTLDFTTAEYIESIKQAHENGLMTDEELAEELQWADEEGPF
jgi:hypothetical protein